ncbi:Sister chromatid cohesion 1 protein 1 [Platanthera zijinensis]|uniref:Sister chromatid cohesion 1 protein 1 n=1 Tax=Platanthera zijinensis TaxID=2320716 RepID=A0AAP0BPD0_9ASPA
MFYSHQLLARKAPLGQIWMAATLGGKIKRRSLDKLDISRICEEILNPSIPMASRLSGILVGGVVNVFKRKVDFLYDDVNRFLDDLNRAFETKIAGVKTQAAKGRAPARSVAGIRIVDKDCAELDAKQNTDPPYLTLQDYKIWMISTQLSRKRSPESKLRRSRAAELRREDDLKRGFWTKVAGIKTNAAKGRAQARYNFSPL